MKFGAWLQPLHHPSENPTLALERDLELIEHLDRLMFDHVWIGEHHSTGWETISSPEIYMMAAASRTKTIRLGGGIIPLAIHHPANVAGRAVLLDHLTRGRSILGVGVGGGLPSDLHVFGLDRKEAQRRFQESFDLIVKLFQGDTPISEKTDWYEIKDFILQLKPQRNLEIAAATANPDTIRKLGKIGGTVLLSAGTNKVQESFEYLQEGASEVGIEASRDQIFVIKNIFLSSTKDLAIQTVKNAIVRERVEFNQIVNGYDYGDLDVETWFENLVDNSLIGTPEEAISKIRKIEAETGGIGGIIFGVKEWADKLSLWNSYELFARYVMPQFQNRTSSLEKAAVVASKINK